MIRGIVNARHEAIVRLRLQGPSEIEADLDAIVDSDFTVSSRGKGCFGWSHDSKFVANSDQ